MDSVGKRVRAARTRLVWTQEDLSQRSGVPIVTISRIENDQLDGQPRQSTVRKLATALGVDPAWVLMGKEDVSRLDEGLEPGKSAA